jgi:hypothetical protein
LAAHLRIGQLVTITGTNDEFVVNRITPTLKSGIHVRAQVDLIAVDELKRRYREMGALLDLSNDGGDK